MQKKVTLKLRRHVQYGHSRYYAGDELAAAILKLMKDRKTFTQKDVDEFKKVDRIELEIEDLAECPEEV